jgi:poly(A) polymerase
MIKTLIYNLIGRGRGAAAHARQRFGKRVEHGPQTHGIDPNLVDERAVTVVRTLKSAGYDAYVVGGAVRDLLLGLRPKDFDVATSATPEQVKALFRRAFIVGRRFRIVHVVFGRGRQHDVIEVSTFRAFFDNTSEDVVAGNERTAKQELQGMKHAVGATGRVLRDNVWGSQEEDAARRDFTLNAMYYDPETRMLVDYHGGMTDVKAKLIRMIGDPVQRYREDPVRVLRAVRFAAKLAKRGFRLDAKTAAPLAMAKAWLSDIPQSRLFDEMLKFLQTGHALDSVAQVKALGLGGIDSLLDLAVERAHEPFVKAALRDTDRRVAEGKPVAPSFLLACLLWQDVRAGWQERMARGMYTFPALNEAIDEIFNARVGEISGRGKLGAEMREIWLMQPRFEKRSGKSPFSLVRQLRFRAGLDFLRLRAEVHEVKDEYLNWWQAFSLADEAAREDLIAQARAEQPRGGSSARRRTPQTVLDEAAATQAASAFDEGPLESERRTATDDEGAAMPRKRRRRHRGGGARRNVSGSGEAEAAPDVDPHPESE